MPPAEFDQPESDAFDGHPDIHCEACQSAFESESRQAVSFLLLDQLTIPAIGCSEHVERFSSVCGLTSEDTADLLDHHPAGGISCPGCRLAPHSSARPLIPVQDGAVMLMACPNHQSEIVQRFQTGLETQQYLSSSVGSSSNLSP